MTDPRSQGWLPHPASFRDPAGFVFHRAGELLRQVNRGFTGEFDRFLDSGLYDELASDGLLVSHEEVDASLAATPEGARVLHPTPIPFISHPPEWCFSQLQAAATLTLEIQRRSLARGMTLRDATAYNVQFIGARPVWIDTLSFGLYEEGAPWTAYGQFCSHFLAPLRVMSDLSPEAGSPGIRHLNGFPLPLASRLLPLRSRLRFSDLFHIHFHARSIERHATDGDEARVRKARLSPKGMTNLIDSLTDAVSSIRAPGGATQWERYEEEHGYAGVALQSKSALVGELTASVEPSVIWDLGSNAGRFSSGFADEGCRVVSIDVDHGAVERAFERSRSAESETWLPLWIDLLCPTPSFGWAGRERESLEDRGPADLVLALALIHHLALSGNVSFDAMARWLARIARTLIIEWVPPDDPQVQRLLVARGETPPRYTRERFLRAFATHFDIKREESIEASDRGLFLLESGVTSRRHDPTPVGPE